MMQLHEAPIQLPQNPYWQVFKRFGRDEIIALLVNVIGTVLVSTFTNSALILSLTGPIIEKIGFFPMHIWEAWKVYKTTPQRRNFLHYISKAFKNGMTSLTEDILVHDPIYILLMMLGISIYPGIPIWLLSATSFVAAVVAVTGLEVTWKELQYWKYKKKMQAAGFEVEVYYEARFYVKNTEDPSNLLNKFAKEFNLTFEGEPTLEEDAKQKIVEYFLSTRKKNSKHQRQDC